MPLLHIYMRIKKGFYKPKNISKYRGDYRKIVYRSGLELKFMRYLDGNDSIHHDNLSGQNPFHNKV